MSLFIGGVVCTTYIVLGIVQSIVIVLRCIDLCVHGIDSTKSYSELSSLSLDSFLGILPCGGTMISNGNGVNDTKAYILIEANFSPIFSVKWHWDGYMGYMMCNRCGLWDRHKSHGWAIHH